MYVAMDGIQTSVCWFADAMGSQATGQQLFINPVLRRLSNHP
jgi:hypothetical protein